MLFCLSCFLACSVGLAIGDTLRSPAPLRYGVKPELWNGLSGRRKTAAQKDEFLAVSHQTKELDRFSWISSFSFLSEHLASFSESQLDAFNDWHFAAHAHFGGFRVFVRALIVW